ncbi:MAG: tyrosine-type recombinase/integrase [Bariatricus sp.]
MSRKGENIYKRKDGRWEARYIKGRTLEGAARYGYCYGKTYQEVKNKVAKAKAESMSSLKLKEVKCGKLFGVYCEEWIRLKRSRVKDATYAKYEMILNKHIRQQFGNLEPEQITETVVEQFSFELLNEKGLSIKTVRDILAVFRSVWGYAVRQNPSLKILEIVYPKEIRKERRVLSCEEQQIFVEFLYKSMDECKFGVLLALMSGLRIGEICALRWSDISIQDRIITVNHTMQRLKNMDGRDNQKTRIAISEPKSTSSARIIPMNRDMETLCRKWEVKNPSAFILTGKSEHYMEPRALQYRMKQYTKECGLEGVHFHTLRHSFATRCVEAGFEIKSLSEILGHSSTSITMECYVHSSLQLKRENMEKLTK